MPISGPTLSGPAALRDLLATGFSIKADETALFSATRTWTWRELSREVDVLAGNLLARGLRPGDRVASLMPNRGELLLHYLACLKAALVVTPLNYRYTPPEIDYALDVSGAAMLLAHAERADDVRATAQVARLASGVVSCGGPLDDATPFEALLEGPTPTAGVRTQDITRPALLFFTSGSTGKPKGVTHSLLSFGSIVASWAQSMGLGIEDVVLGGSSIAHVGSLATSLAGFATGASVVVADGLGAGELLALLRERRPSVLLTLPSTLIALARHPDATRDDFHSLRLCVSGSDKFPASLHEEFTARTGLPIQETYGLTEATSCLFNSSDSIEKSGSLGTVAAGYLASIRDDHGEELSANVDGNLWLQGAPVMVGYWNNPEATKTALVEGWFDTGDVMRVDADGYFWFRGRRKQIIVHDGSNIAPQEVEDALMAHPAVALAGVVGVRDEVHGENVWAFVTWNAGVDPPDSKHLIEFVRDRVGYKAPEVVVAIDEMPINATGKVDRMTLKKRAAARLTLVER